LTADYHDLAVAVQGLGFLESGITDPLNHFSNTLLEFSALLRHLVGPSTVHLYALLIHLQSQTTTDPLLVQLHSLLTYSHANRAVLRLRDQKQLDTEELSDYLSGVTAERDRLSAIISGHAGSSGLGLGAYLKDRVDALRGADDDRSRVEKMKKLDTKIKEVGAFVDALTFPGLIYLKKLQDAVTTAHETSDAFNDATLREQTIFQFAKQAEMKETFSELADGQIEFYKAVRDRCIVSSS
jgi:sorting nexin-4